jgi:xanthine dehydrogenase accessory factor
MNSPLHPSWFSARLAWKKKNKKNSGTMSLDALILGAGDLATGVALKLHRAGVQVVMTEVAQPMVVRRTVAFASAVYENGSFSIEGVTCRVAHSLGTISQCHSHEEIPLLIDEQADILKAIEFDLLVDARMLKKYVKLRLAKSPFRIGLGPGFIAGDNCHAAIETKRGATMGSVLWTGSAEPDTGIPGSVKNKQEERVLRSPANGIFKTKAEIGEIVEEGVEIATVGDRVITAPFKGLIRGLLHDGLTITKGTKVGDIDPRLDVRLCRFVSDKSMLIGCGVLEVILQVNELRRKLLAT